MLLVEKREDQQQRKIELEDLLNQGVILISIIRDMHKYS